MKKMLPEEPQLRFTPYAWSKLIFMRDMTDNEVGGFGITATDDLLLVTDIVIIKQKVTVVTVNFDDIAVANYFEDMVDKGLKPEQFARIWIHTHPGFDPDPSGTDEQTFNRVFGNCNFSVMAIIAKKNKSYCRLHFNSGICCDINIPIKVDYEQGIDNKDIQIWEQIYKDNVAQEKVSNLSPHNNNPITNPDYTDRYSMYTLEDIIEEIGMLSPVEREMLMNELATQDFQYESEVYYE
ncbi:MAG: hypothetical protein JEZ07_15720 [Phycisphaerae bacterium]|nr:hypothetical protein [Phycisphaerae bacterium]